MTTGEIIAFIFVCALAAAGFVLGALQYMQKGIPLNNAYIYASKRERETMDKKPRFRQSATVFLLLGVIFAAIAAAILTKRYELKYLYLPLMAVLIVYAIASDIVIRKKENRDRGE